MTSQIGPGPAKPGSMKLDSLGIIGERQIQEGMHVYDEKGEDVNAKVAVDDPEKRRKFEK